MTTRTSFVLALSLLCLLPSLAAAQPEPGPRDAHKTLQLTTAASLLVTSTLGTLVAINQPTIFSDGRCATGEPIFGDYGCKGLSVIHGLSALLSLVLYTATTTLEFAEFDWPGRDRHGTAYEVASYVHLIGMGLQPIGGILAAVPDVIGLERDAVLTRVLRSIHVMTGYAIVGTYVATATIEL